MWLWVPEVGTYIKIADGLKSAIIASTRFSFDIWFVNNMRFAYYSIKIV